MTTISEQIPKVLALLEVNDGKKDFTEIVIELCPDRYDAIRDTCIRGAIWHLAHRGKVEIDRVTCEVRLLEVESE